MKSLMFRVAGSASGGKKIILLAVATFLPILVSAATLSNTFSTSTLFPAFGSTSSLSGTCGVSGANSNVTFALTQNGISTALSTPLNTDANGAFSGNIVYPSTYPAGQATLVATCSRTGDTVNSQILTFAAPAGTAFSLPGNLPTIGGILTLSGACGFSNGIGTALITLSNNGANFQLGTVNLSPTGTFTSSVAIPNTAGIGSGTLTAVCSNRTTFSSAIKIGQPAVDTFAFGTAPFPGSSTSVSGNCNNVSGNSNGTVGFSVMRNGVSTVLTAANTWTNGNGTFNSQASFPTSIGKDPATFIVTCPNGSTFSNVIMLGATVFASIPVGTTPVGGVAAGFGPKDSSGIIALGEILLIIGSLGLVGTTGMKIYAKKRFVQKSV